MAFKTGIEWTESTWNPVTGCSKISAGCLNCYAERMARRLQAMGVASYIKGFSVALHEEALELPNKWRKPRAIFVNSMSDLFHEGVPEAFIRQVFSVMNRARQHRYQILTKRSERLMQIAPSLPWAENIWMGVTVEDERNIHRVDHLRKSPAAVKFLSLEPLLGPVSSLVLDGIDWVIVGGESGPGARPIEERWVLDIKEKCQGAGVPFFFKQWGGVKKKKAGRLLQGRIWDQMPDIRIG
ncbi:MAG: phage Gp37/Gp68 family protein [Candidatus Aminicenantes bacterium]|nr:phage Gp37/Gp68 family protein [Candidatus Aminicenantes bacterium]